MLGLKSRNLFWGPSIYARCPVVRLVVELDGDGVGPDLPINKPLRDGCALLFADQVVRPALDELLARPTAHIGEILAALVLEFQRLMHIDVDFCSVRDLANGEFAVVYEFDTLPTAAVAETGVTGFLNEFMLGDKGQKPDLRANALAGRDWILGQAVARARHVDTQHLLEAARQRDIPFQSLGADYILLGQGCRSRRLDAKLDDRISHAAMEGAQDKQTGNARLREAWLPVPTQGAAASADQAVAAAEEIGYPVVIKPRSLGRGKAVTVDAKSAAEVESAFTRAAAEGTYRVVVEAFLEGADHRLLVIDGQLIAAAKRIPGHVVGDGHSSVSELVAKLNTDLRRGPGMLAPLATLVIDDEAQQLLKSMSLNVASVPLRGQRVPLRRVANLSRGGTAVDVTDQVHPDNRYVAENAAQALNLAVAGVDFICPDISRSYKEVGGGICEINANPGLRMHYAPSEGKPRDVTGALIHHLFPDPAASRIPVAAVTGTNGKTTTCRMLRAILAQHGLIVGLTSTEGVWIGNEQVARGDWAGPVAARQILRDHRVEAAVLECSRGGIIKRGVGFDDCNVAAVTNVRDDHLGEDGVTDLDGMARVKALIPELARDMVVLNADDERCRAMAGHVTAKRLCWVSMTKENPVVDAHVAVGGTATRLSDDGDDSIIELFADSERHGIMPVSAIPATMNGIAEHNIANALFAVALAHGLGVPIAAIRDALGDFDCDYTTNPGRLNPIHGLPCQALLDFAANLDAYGVLHRVVDRMPIEGERVLVFTARVSFDDDLVRSIAELNAGHFDRFVCYSPAPLPNRTRDEIPLLLYQALTETGVMPHKISLVACEADAIDAALRSATPDDLVVIKSNPIAHVSWQAIQATVDSFKQGYCL